MKIATFKAPNLVMAAGSAHAIKSDEKPPPRNGIIAMEALPRYYLPDEQLLGLETDWTGWFGNGPGNHRKP